MAGTLEHVRNELTYITQKRLPKDITNEAPWVYLRGLYHTEDPTTHSADKFKRVPLSSLIDDLRPFLLTLPENRFAVMCMADIFTVEKDL